MRMTAERWRALFYLGPLVAWSASIADMSTHQGKMDHSAFYIRWLVNTLSPAFARSLDSFQFFCLHYASRKTAHVAEYLILGLLAVRAAQWGREGLRWRSVAAGIAFPAVFSTLDEVHQAFVPGRTPSGWDVLLDVSGASVGVLFICLAGLHRHIEMRLWGRKPGHSREEVSEA
jgi:VanZ family protein